MRSDSRKAASLNDAPPSPSHVSLAPLAPRQELCSSHSLATALYETSPQLLDSMDELRDVSSLVCSWFPPSDGRAALGVAKPLLRGGFHASSWCAWYCSLLACVSLLLLPLLRLRCVWSYWCCCICCLVSALAVRNKAHVRVFD